MLVTWLKWQVEAGTLPWHQLSTEFFKKLDYFFFTLWRVIIFILVNISHCKNNLPFIVCTRCCFYWVQHISYFQLFAHAQQFVPVHVLSLFFLSLSAFLALLIYYCDFGETPPAFSVHWAGSRNHQLLPLPGTPWCHQLLWAALPSTAGALVYVERM